MVVLGAVPSVYQPLHPADDLVRCQRYYETWKPNVGTYPWFGYMGAASQAPIIPIQFHTWKAIAPTMTKFGTWTVANCAQPSFNGSSVDCFNLTTTVTAAGSFGLYPGDATCYVGAEANP